MRPDRIRQNSNLAVFTASILRAHIENCSFDGARAAPQWWSSSDSSDRFLGWLRQVVAAVVKELGQDSKAAQSLERYLNDFETSRTKDKDFSACLYDGTVPNEELDRIEPILNDLEGRIGW